MSAERLVVFFPGAGYGVDAPLLYYTDFLFETKGYQHFYVDYTQAWEEQLAERIANATDIVFVSKSIGAVQAGKTAEKLGCAVRHIFITPVGAALPYIHKECRVVIGTEDGEYHLVREWCEQHSVSCLAVEGADHSMELFGRPHESIDVLHRILNYISDFCE